MNSFDDVPDPEPQPDPRWSVIRYERHMRRVIRMGAVARQCVREWQSGKSLTGDSGADVSLCYLMLRMICESMVLASVKVHDAFLDTLNERIVNKQWNASRIVKEIERVNPEWYPKPIIITPTDTDPEDQPPSSFEIDRLPRGEWLTRAEFIKLYSTCHRYLHARAHGQKEVDAAMEDAAGACSGLALLLKQHLVDLPNNVTLVVEMLGQCDGQVEVHDLYFDPDL